MGDVDLATLGDWRVWGGWVGWGECGEGGRQKCGDKIRKEFGGEEETVDKGGRKGRKRWEGRN